MRLEPTEAELSFFEICHHPALWQEFLTPVDDNGSDLLPLNDWLEEDHWGKVRPYQYPTLPWHHLLPSDIPIDGTRVPNYRGIDRVSLGDANIFGGRNTSKSFDIHHDILEAGAIRRGEQTCITCRDDMHLTQRIESIWAYAYNHPLIKSLVSRHVTGDPYARLFWYNGHQTVAVYESTSGEGENYLGHHFHQINVDEYQLTSKKADQRMHDAVTEYGGVKRCVGVSDGRRDTPAHEVRADPERQRLVHRRPQCLRESWTPAAKAAAIKQYNGADTQEYVTNVDAEEGDPASGVWNIRNILACMETLPEDKRRPVEKRRKQQCPILSLTGRELEAGRKMSDIELPQESDPTMDIWLSMDVGKLVHPAVIGIWAIDDDYIPHEIGKVVLYRLEYEDQAKVVLRMVKRYGASRVGVDRTGADGIAVMEHIERLRKDAEFEVVPCDSRATIEIADPKVSKLGGLRRRGAKKRKKDKKMVGLKHFVTLRLLAIFARRKITLLYDLSAVLEFQSEVATAPKRASSARPVVYNAPQGSHRIDETRIMVYMLYMVTDRKSQGKASQPGFMKHRRAIALGRL